MDPFTNDDLELLVSRRSPACVSIYLPTHPTWPQNKSDTGQLQNLLREAEADLARNMRPVQAREFLEPARRLLEDETFRREQDRGLAIFLDEGFERHYRLPLPFEPLVTVGGHFTIRPLLPLIADDCLFFVLALSQDEVRLVRCTRHHAWVVPLPPHPHDVGDATGYEEPQRGTSFHGGERTGQGQRHAAVTHAIGVRPHDSKRDVLEYAQAIDRCLHPLLRDERAPLVLAGVDPLLSTYRRANTYGHLLAESVHGATDRLDPDALRTKAWPLVEADLRAARQPLIDRVRASMGTGSATTDPVEIVRAAYAGKVATLLVDRGRAVWGRFLPAHDIIDTYEGPQSDAEDLVDRACLHTLAHRGTVVVVPDDEMAAPASPMAALLRR